MTEWLAQNKNVDKRPPQSTQELEGPVPARMDEETVSKRNKRAIHDERMEEALAELRHLCANVEPRHAVSALFPPTTEREVETAMLALSKEAVAIDDFQRIILRGAYIYWARKNNKGWKQIAKDLGISNDEVEVLHPKRAPAIAGAYAVHNLIMQDEMFKLRYLRTDNFASWLAFFALEQDNVSDYLWQHREESKWWSDQDRPRKRPIQNRLNLPSDYIDETWLLGQ